jgi:hypothetical protein
LFLSIDHDWCSAWKSARSLPHCSRVRSPVNRRAELPRAIGNGNWQASEVSIGRHLAFQLAGAKAEADLFGGVCDPARYPAVASLRR